MNAEEDPKPADSDSSEECIICLSNLPNCPLDQWDSSSVPASISSTLDGLRIAKIPCGHYFHNHCLESWCRVANTCPLCRTEFLKVDVLEFVKGPWYRAYPVEEKTQSVANAGEPFEDEGSETCRCVICGRSDHAEVLLLCDGCDDAYHTYCLNMDAVPIEEFYCPNCVLLNYQENETLSSRISLSRRGQTRRRRVGAAARASRVSQQQQRAWTRAWNAIRNRAWDALNSDLSYYGMQQERLPARDVSSELLRRRIESARLRSNQLNEPVEQPRVVQTPVTNASEQQAWNDFDEILHANSSVHSVATEPTISSPRPSSGRFQQTPIEEHHQQDTRFVNDPNSTSHDRRQKRPTRRHIPSSNKSSGSSTVLDNNSSSKSENSFLASLISNINQPSTSRIDTSFMLSLQNEIKNSHSEASDGTSDVHLTPLFSNLSPRPSHVPLSPREISNDNLDDHLIELSEPGEIVDNHLVNDTSMHQRRTSGRHDLVHSSKKVSYETKYRIERLVNAALKPYYREAKISKDQFALFNKNICRSVYTALSDGTLSLEGPQQHKISKTIREKVVNCIQSLSND
ncbi:CTD-binding SR-like protein rA9 [Schizosaccharomyces pombe]